MIAAYNSVLLGESKNFFEFVTWPPICSIIHLSQIVAKWQFQRNFEAYLKVHCYMELSLNFKAFKCMTSPE